MELVDGDMNPLEFKNRVWNSIDLVLMTKLPDFIDQPEDPRCGRSWPRMNLLGTLCFTVVP